MTDNEMKAKALIIGKQLSKINWFDMTAGQAHAWCREKALLLGAKEQSERDTIACIAMNYVIAK